MWGAVGWDLFFFFFFCSSLGKIGVVTKNLWSNVEPYIRVRNERHLIRRHSVSLAPPLTKSWIRPWVYDQAFNFSNAIPYILHFQKVRALDIIDNKSKSTSIRHHQTIKKPGIIQFLISISISLSDSIWTKFVIAMETAWWNYLFRTSISWNSPYIFCIA